MIIRTYIPPSPLSDFVELFWLYEGFTQPVKERALPTGTVELVINLREDRLQVFDRRDTDQAESFRGSMICGPHSEFFVIDSAQDESILGVHFRPGGAYPFLKLPAGELHNARVSLDMLWGTKAVALRDRLLDVRTPEAKFRILEQCLMAQVVGPLTRHPAVSLRAEGVPRCTACADDLRGDGSDRHQSEAIHSALPRRSRADAKAVLSRSALPRGSAPHRERASGVGGRRSRLRLLRPGAFHQRLPSFFRPQPDSPCHASGRS